MEPDASGRRQLTDSLNGSLKRAVDFIDDRIKMTRHPRWTRQETLVLLEAKNSVENQTQRGHRSGSFLGTDQTEPKWDSISSYCRQLGVNRTPAQCRKRWGNLLCDFRKIKTWESSNEEAESFWMMRNELRKENRLPSFFDRQVYDTMDGKASESEAIPLAFVTARTEGHNEDGEDNAVAEDEWDQEEEAEAVFESGLSMDLEQSRHDEVGWRTRTRTRKETFETKTYRKIHTLSPPISGTMQKGNPVMKTRKESASGEGCKKRRLSSTECDDKDCRSRLIKVLESNSKTLNVQLAAQNLNYELDRKQRKEFNDSLVSVLNKLTDALIKIANKL